MSDYKEDVLEMIDRALTANRAEGVCTCRFAADGVRGCNYCTILEGLIVAKACIIANVGDVDWVRINAMIMKIDIEEKLLILPEG